MVVIDLQNDITKNYREIIEKVNDAIDWAVQKKLLVVYIQHNNLSDAARTFKPGTRGAELVPELKIVSNHIFTKSKSNALTSEEFAEFIQKHGITEFYIAGADTAACVKSTCFNMRKCGVCEVTYHRCGKECEINIKNIPYNSLLIRRHSNFAAASFSAIIRLLIIIF